MKNVPERVENMQDEELENAIDELSSEIKSAEKKRWMAEIELGILKEELNKRISGHYLPVHDRNMIDFELSLVKKPRRIA